MRTQLLSAEQVAELSKRSSKQDLTEYKTLLQNMVPGTGIEITLDENDDSKRAVKRRFTMSAKELNISIRYRAADEDNKLIFEVAQNKASSKRVKEAVAA